MIKGEPQTDDPVRPEAPTLRLNIDPIAKRIIGMLQTDGRRSYAEMAHALGVPEDVVERRVQDLVDSEVIQITAVCEPERVGLAAQAMLAVICEPGLGRVVAERLAERGEYVYVVLTGGGFDVMAEVYARDEEHLADLITQLAAMDGVTTVQRYPYAGVVKQIYTWGVH